MVPGLHFCICNSDFALYGSFAPRVLRTKNSDLMPCFFRTAEPVQKDQNFRFVGPFCPELRRSFSNNLPFGPDYISLETLSASVRPEPNTPHHLFLVLLSSRKTSTLISIHIEWKEWELQRKCVNRDKIRILWTCWGHKSNKTLTLSIKFVGISNFKLKSKLKVTYAFFDSQH